MAKKNRRTKTQAPAKAERSPLWNHRLFPLVFFLALSLLYFYEFPLSDKIVFGMDVGTDYHKGADLSFWGKGADCGPADVGSQDGRLSSV